MKKIVEKWYKELGFDKKYDEEFYAILEKYEIDADASIDSYSPEKYSDEENALNYLYMCESAKKRYSELGIGLDIMYATLKDIVFYSAAQSEIKGHFCLGEYGWITRHLSLNLFQLGRLQLGMGECEHDIPEYGICKGDNVLEMHIPEGGPLDKAECLKSVELAKEFFAKYFPDFKYEHFTTDTWLLDTTINDLLKPSSNIIKFQEMFDIVERKKSDEILRYVFKWNSNRSNIKDEFCKSKFAELIKNRALSGGDFYEALGVLK